MTEEKADLLRYLASLGLLPDTDVAVESVAPFGGPVLVRVADAQYALGSRGRRQDHGPRLKREPTVER